MTGREVQHLRHRHTKARQELLAMYIWVWWHHRVVMPEVMAEAWRGRWSRLRQSLSLKAEDVFSSEPAFHL
jgi:hypothetical protein